MSPVSGGRDRGGARPRPGCRAGCKARIATRSPCGRQLPTSPGCRRRPARAAVATAVGGAGDGAGGGAVVAPLGSVEGSPTVAAAAIVGTLGIAAAAVVGAAVGVARRRAACRDSAGGLWWEITPPARPAPGSAKALWQLLGGLLRRHPAPWCGGLLRRHPAAWWSPTRLAVEVVATPRPGAGRTVATTRLRAERAGGRGHARRPDHPRLRPGMAYDRGVGGRADTAPRGLGASPGPDRARPARPHRPHPRRRRRAGTGPRRRRSGTRGPRGGSPAVHRAAPGARPKNPGSASVANVATCAPREEKAGRRARGSRRRPMPCRPPTPARTARRCRYGRPARRWSRVRPRRGSGTQPVAECCERDGGSGGGFGENAGLTLT